MCSVNYKHNVQCKKQAPLIYYFEACLHVRRNVRILDVNTISNSKRMKLNIHMCPVLYRQLLWRIRRTGWLNYDTWEVINNTPRWVRHSCRFSRFICIHTSAIDTHKQSTRSVLSHDRQGTNMVKLHFPTVVEIRRYSNGKCDKRT
jgi:hypothetical protein